MKLILRLTIAFVFFTSSITVTWAQGSAQPVSIAVLPFTVTGDGMQGMEKDLQALLTAQLSSDPQMLLVERAEVDAALSEAVLGLSGTVSAGSAAKIGHIVGAQVLVTGRVFPVQRELALIAKVVSVETSRVFGVTARMPIRGSVIDASVTLAEKIASVVQANSVALVAPVQVTEDKLIALKSLLKGKDLPTVSIRIPEVSLTRQVPDPAAETEMSLVLQKLGFTLLDPLVTNVAADIDVSGEAFSEFAFRRADLVSVKGRVEIKVLNHKDGSVLVVDRETTTAVDLSPEIAGKFALQKAGRILAERLAAAIAKTH